MTYRVLVVDADLALSSALTRALEVAGYAVDRVRTGGDAGIAIERGAFDVVLLGHDLADAGALEILRSAHAADPGLPIVMIAAHATLEGAVQAIKAGAYDYLAKPVHVEQVLRVVARAAKTRRRCADVAPEGAGDLGEDAPPAFVAESPAMRRIRHLVRRVAASEASTVLVTGESGVGKGVIARLLHRAGSRSRGPFQTVTCTALSESLLESELFGHEKGAGGDGFSLQRGLCELADGGTLFLDEVGDLSPALQRKLLRFLEEKTFHRVGGTRDVHVAARVVAATQRDLGTLVARDLFRRDLFYRLKVIPIEIPPLRERPEDLLPLAAAFVERFARELKKRARGFDREAREMLLGYPWPGNVRELRNAVERAVLIADLDVLRAQDLPPEVRGHALAAGPACAPHAFLLPRCGIVLEQVERSLVEQALALAHGSRTGAARLLGLNRDQVRYRIEKFGLAGEHANERP